MKFTTKLTAAEKRLVYERALVDTERRIINAIVSSGEDPDKFDNVAYIEKSEDAPGSENDELLKLLKAHENIKNALESL